MLWIQTAEKSVFEVLNTKLETILGPMQWLEGQLSFEDTWWKELGAMNFAQLGCCGTT